MIAAAITIHAARGRGPTFFMRVSLSPLPPPSATSGSATSAHPPRGIRRAAGRGGHVDLVPALGGRAGGVRGADLSRGVVEVRGPRGRLGEGDGPLVRVAALPGDAVIALAGVPELVLLTGAVVALSV